MTVPLITPFKSLGTFKYAENKCISMNNLSNMHKLLNLLQSFISGIKH